MSNVRFRISYCLYINNFGFQFSNRRKSEIENPKSEILTLPDQDSNLDKRYQKPSYYHYTIRQSPMVCYPSQKGTQI
jgi:hypothetical protein